MLINKSLSIEVLINSWLIVGKLCQVRGTVSLQATLYIFVCSSDKYWCVPVTYMSCASYIYCRVSVYCLYVLVIVDFLLLSFKLIVRCLFRPHHVNQGGVQKTTPQVTLYKPDTAKESLRRRRSGRYSQVLHDHAGQAWELLLVLLTPHERVCVLGHLLHSHVCKTKLLMIFTPRIDSVLHVFSFENSHHRRQELLRLPTKQDVSHFSLQLVSQDSTRELFNRLMT